MDLWVGVDLVGCMWGGGQVGNEVYARVWGEEGHSANRATPPGSWPLPAELSPNPHHHRNSIGPVLETAASVLELGGGLAGAGEGHGATGKVRKVCWLT